jgi:biopolymer transport protein ExbB
MSDHSHRVSSFLIPTLRNSRAGWILSILLTVVLCGAGWSSAVAAYDPPSVQAENGAVAPGDDSDSSPNLTMLEWLFKALGWLYTIVFLILSFVFVALVIMNVLSARQQQICPAELIEGFEARLDEKKYQEAYELAKADESFLGKVLSAG